MILLVTDILNESEKQTSQKNLGFFFHITSEKEYAMDANFLYPLIP